MIRHIVSWTFKDGFNAAENRQNAKDVKNALEGLKGVIEEIISFKVTIDLLPTSNADVLLDSRFEDEAALAAYQVHPAHQKVSAFVGTVMQNRRCLDFME